MELIKVIEEVQEWQRKTFPDQPIQNVAAHLRNESIELYDALVGIVSPDNSEEELIDVFILSINLMGRYGWSVETLTEKIKNKLEINKARVWEKSGDNYHHK